MNVKSCLPLDMMSSPREVKGMAKDLFCYTSVIYAALLKRINLLVYSRTGSSCSPSVVGAFFIIFRGLSYSEVIEWFKAVYVQHRPVTADQYPDFPNLTKFKAVFQILCGCLVNPTINFLGFNLVGEISLWYRYVDSQYCLIFLIIFIQTFVSKECIRDCSNELQCDITCAGCKPSIGPLSVPPSTRQ